MPSVTKWNVVSPLMRIVAPPSLPSIVGPGTADGSEHVAADDPRSDILQAARREVVVEASCTTVATEHALKRACCEDPFVQRGASDPKRVAEALIGPSAVAV